MSFDTCQRLVLLAEELTLFLLHRDKHSQDLAVLCECRALLKLRGPERLQEPDVCPALFLQARNVAVGRSGGPSDGTHLGFDRCEVRLDAL